MKECPKCKAQVSDTAKFCIKCGFNIKKHEEENSKHFCPECGTQFSGGNFCPECGYDITKDINPETVIKESNPKVETNKKTNKGKSKPNIDLDSFGLDFDNVSSALERQFNDNKLKEQLMLFEYSEYKTGGYVIKKYVDTIETNVIVPNGVVAINDGAFENTLVISVKLPEGIKLIGKRAFANCKYLSNINIPSSVNRIESEAFYNCESLDLDIPKTVSIKGKDLMVNTLTEAKAKKKAEEERLAKKRAEEQRIAKELADYKSKIIEDINKYANNKQVVIKSLLYKIENANNTSEVKTAKDFIVKYIDDEYKKMCDAKMLAQAKETAIKNLTSYASSNGVTFTASYNREINSATSKSVLDDKINQIRKDIDSIVKERIDKKKALELEEAKTKAINEVTNYAKSKGVTYSSTYTKSINSVSKLADLSSTITDVKKKIDKEQEKKRLEKIAQEKKAAEQKRIDKEAEEIFQTFEKYKSKVTIVDKDHIDFGLFPQTEKKASVNIIKNDGLLAYGDDGRLYSRRFFYNPQTKQYDIMKYHEYQYIRWTILKETRNNYLLVSSYIISAVEFNDTLDDRNGYPANNYENSGVRKYCNDSFLNRAFNKEAIAKIEDTLVENGKKTTALLDGFFSKDTVDKVFLLSYREVEKYFKNMSVCRPVTQYAKSFLACDKYSSWWTRSPGIYKNGYDAKSGATMINYRDACAHANAVTEVYGFLPAIVLKKK